MNDVLAMFLFVVAFGLGLFGKEVIDWFLKFQAKLEHRKKGHKYSLEEAQKIVDKLVMEAQAGPESKLKAEDGPVIEFGEGVLKE